MDDDFGPPGDGTTSFLGGPDSGPPPAPGTTDL